MHVSVLGNTKERISGVLTAAVFSRTPAAEFSLLNSLLPFSASSGRHSPDKLISASYSKLVRVCRIHVDGVETHFLILLLCHHQFSSNKKRRKKEKDSCFNSKQCPDGKCVHGSQLTQSYSL